MMKLQKNRKLKRLIAVFLLMALLFTACGETADESETVPEKTESEALTEPASETAPESESESETEEIKVELPDYMPLEELVKAHTGWKGIYSPEQAREDGCIVEGNDPKAQELVPRFLELGSEGKEATLRYYRGSVDSAPVVYDITAKADGTYAVTQSAGYPTWNGETVTRLYTHMNVIMGSEPWNNRYTYLYLTNHSDLRALDLDNLSFAAMGYDGYDVFLLATSAEKWDERIDPYLLKGETEGFDFRMLLCDGTELTFVSDSPVFTWDGKEYDVSENADRLLSAADLEAEGRIFLVGEKDGIYYVCHWKPGSTEFAWEKTWEKQS